MMQRQKLLLDIRLSIFRVFLHLDLPVRTQKRLLVPCSLTSCFYLIAVVESCKLAILPISHMIATDTYFLSARYLLAHCRHSLQAESSPDIV